MRAIISFVAAIVAAVPCSAQEAAKPAENPDKAADYYPTKAGTKWHYVGELNNGRKFLFLCQVAKVEEVDGKPRARVETVVNGQLRSAEQIGTDASGVFRYRSEDAPISPPAPLLKYPVKEGETWTAEFKVGDRPSTLNGKTGKWEKVVVPAGTYQAIPVEIDMKTGDFNVHMISWFVPGVGIIKQTVQNQGFVVKRELHQYEAGK
jgi:hypothetical protein